MFAFDVLALPDTPDFGSEVEFDAIYDWETELDTLGSTDDFVTYSDFRNNLCLAATTAATCLTNLNNRKIRFDTADELYRFSLDVSLNFIYQTAIPAENVKLSTDKMALLMSLYYILGNDIDYSVMNAKTFAPIGYDFRDTSNVAYKNVFSGTFDGQGLHDLESLCRRLRLHDLRRPNRRNSTASTSPCRRIIRCSQSTKERSKTSVSSTRRSNCSTPTSTSTAPSNLVGFNAPHRTSSTTSSSSTTAPTFSKRASATASARRSQSFSAAGIVHTNLGTFTNAYYSSKVVVNGSLAQPVRNAADLVCQQRYVSGQSRVPEPKPTSSTIPPSIS
ncbi:MAG: hypothetical protein MZU97_24120 [Bacillus subtilis]|nr:hypothetical protein [Bacillus subtilis]